MLISHPVRSETNTGGDLIALVFPALGNLKMPLLRGWIVSFLFNPDVTITIASALVFILRYDIWLKIALICN